MYGAATGELNGTIPEQFPINSESFMTTTVTEPYDGTASNVARHKVTNITASYIRDQKQHQLSPGRGNYIRSGPKK